MEIDRYSLDLLNQLHPKLRPIAIEAWQEAVNAMPVGVKIQVTQTYRTFAESDVLYAQGRTNPGQSLVMQKPGNPIIIMLLPLICQ